jgi:outer membrane lipoprotein-sorting protein
MTRIVRHLAFLALLAVTGIVFAGPKEELHDAFIKFLDASSFRATLTDVAKGTTLSELEFVAPDRYRVSMPNGPSQVIVGDSMYMNMSGRYMKMPIPAGKIAAQYRSRSALDEMEKGLAVDALGPGTVDGEAARVYHYVTTQGGKADVKTWVSTKSGLPLQVETTGSDGRKKQTVRIRYRDFNDPGIRVDVPK